MISDEAFEKAVTTATGKSEAPATPAPTPEPVIEAPKQETPAPVETKPEENNSEWDGDVNKLPKELQSWAKKAQRTFTKKAMTEAETRRLGEEYKQFQASPEFKAFQTWKQQGSQVRAVAPAPQPAAQPNISQQEWEEAQLDPTGQKFNALVERKVNEKINEAAQIYGNELAQLRSTQQVTQFQTTLADFAELNPDVIQLHEDGIMKPLLEEEMRTGSHKSYEEMVHAAYERGKAIQEKANARAMALSQGRVLEKKSAVTQTGTQTGEAEIAYVDKGKTFDEAFNFALQGKKVKVKAKQ
jgi:hypothetical protein